MRCSTSFSSEEIKFLSEFFRLASRGGDVTYLLRSKPSASVRNKIQNMETMIATATEATKEPRAAG
jgi:hypothetical protein